MKAIFKKATALLLAVIITLTPLTVTAFTESEGYVTRGEFAAFISNVFQLPPAEGYANFYDVPADHPFASAIMSVNALGFMVGDGAGLFNPDNAISGAELAVILNNVIGFDGSRVPQANVSVPAWAAPSVSVLLDLAMVDAELITKASLTWEETAQFVDALFVALMIAPGTPYALQQVDLRDNFFSYINRQFLATAAIPAGSIMASSFGEVAEIVVAQQEAILFDMLNNPNIVTGSDEWRIRELYNMFLDNETRIASIELLEPYFDAIRNAETIEEFLAVARRYSVYFDMLPYYSMSFSRDSLVDGTQWAAFITAAPLTLGSRDVYVDNPALAPLHAAYIDLHVVALEIIGETENLDERALAMFELEQQRAARMHPTEYMMDMQMMFMPVTWDEVLEATGVTQSITFNEEVFERALEMNVYSSVLEYVAFINSLYVEENLQLLKDIAKVMMFFQFSPVLDDAFSAISDDLLSVMFGMPMGGDLTIEDRAQQFVTSAMWRTFSRAYYQRFSSEELKRDVTEMTEEIRDVMRDMIKDIPWMTYETRLASIEKLDAVTAYIAFPDTPVAEVPFTIRAQADGGNLVEFMMSVTRFNNEMWSYALDMPANTVSLWEQLPTYTVNAFYNPMENAIIIPAGILQYPFYCVTSSREQNLGAIGAVIAHEFVHAFDPMGSQFDKYGTMTMWWTEADVEAFAARNQHVIGILNSIEFAGMNIIGALQVGEAVTDLGAMEVALTVASRMEDADLALVMESWARIWATRMTPEVTHFLMMNGPHLPAKLRTNFILAQLNEFYEVFGVVAGDGMYTPVEERISFWR